MWHLKLRIKRKKRRNCFPFLVSSLKKKSTYATILKLLFLLIKRLCTKKVKKYLGDESIRRSSCGTPPLREKSCHASNDTTPIKTAGDIFATFILKKLPNGRYYDDLPQIQTFLEQKEKIKGKNKQFRYLLHK